MSTLLAVTYETESNAKRTRDVLLELQRKELLVVRDAVVATRTERRINLHQLRSLVAEGAVSGGFWGALLGLLFGVPVFGLGVGALTGALGGLATDYGIDDTFIRDLTRSVPVGSSVLLVLMDTEALERVAEALQGPDSTLLYTNVDANTERRLQQLLAA